MEVMKLLDEMEVLIDSGSRIPLLGKVLIDAETLFDLMDKIRACLPEEIRQAKYVNLEKEKMLQESRQYADKILEDANNQAKKIIAEDQIVKQAQIHAEELMQQAKKTSVEIKQGAKIYANDLLHQLEINLEKALYTIKKGREELQNNQSRTSA